jgi:hypothetical protein
MTSATLAYSADVIANRLGYALVEGAISPNAARRYRWDVEGLLLAVRRESEPGWPPTGHIDPRAPWLARHCAHRARVLGLVE